jgi:hypothetical protein
MKPMRARRAPKWQLSGANVFALLRERYLTMDTIPKPRGLGSGDSLDGLLVQLSSSFCPGFVHLLSSLNARGVKQPMESKFKDVLKRVLAKPGRSRLEPYGELVDELRHKGLTCRDIAAVLAQKCEFQTSKSAVNNFVRARARRISNTRRQISRRAGIPLPVIPKPATPHSGLGLSDDEVRQRIAALKARKPATSSPDNGFYFDPSEPLRLINPGKIASDD